MYNYYVSDVSKIAPIAAVLYIMKIIYFIQLFQSLEEERIAFLRNAMWVYTNTTSLNCVKVDEVRRACAVIAFKH